MDLVNYEPDTIHFIYIQMNQSNTEYCFFRYVFGSFSITLKIAENLMYCNKQCILA